MVQAQIRKGNKLVGASFGSSNIAIGEGAALSLQLNPTVGFLVTDKWMLGGSVTLGAIVAEGFTGLVGISPFTRYYFNNKNNKDSLYKGFFLQAGIGVARVFGEAEYGSWQQGLGGGYSRFITPDIGLEIAALINNTQQLDGIRDNNVNLQFSFGLQIILDKRISLFKRKKS